MTDKQCTHQNVKIETWLGSKPYKICYDCCEELDITDEEIDSFEELSIEYL